MTYMQRIKMKYGEKGAKAVSEFVTLGQLDKEANTPSERATWETMWREFKTSNQGILAIYIVGREGDW